MLYAVSGLHETAAELSAAGEESVRTSELIFDVDPDPDPERTPVTNRSEWSCLVPPTERDG